MIRLFCVTCLLILSAACSRLADVGKAPEFTPITGSYEHHAMISDSLPLTLEDVPAVQHASLWSRDRQSLLGDRRARRRGDIMTVVIEINDRAEISNSTGRSRSGSESMSIPNLLGLPQVIDRQLAGNATLADGVDASGASTSSGNGSVRRNEKLTLRVAATVVEVLPNGVARIQGSQEVRVNFEVRELLVSGFVRPEDISRQNEVTYDKIASARISYGGRGQITDMQQPRYGQQVADIILPF
jgi:flagellar L-ring protein precursor FlgH